MCVLCLAANKKKSQIYIIIYKYVPAILLSIDARILNTCIFTPILVILLLQ